jgi:dTDP-4-dehydrorhamnose 3,5-epimerase-like enzyme
VTSALRPRLLAGGVNVDDRGTVRHVNAFEFDGVKRFYVVENHRVGLVRAWHGHRREAKYVTVLTGAALVAAVAIEDWESPALDTPVERFVLSANSPAVLFVPAGHANGFMSLTADARLVFFSTATLEESKGDDVRFPARTWDPWGVEER